MSCTTLFLRVGGVLCVVGLVPFVRFLILPWFTNDNGGAGRHVQSLVIGGVPIPRRLRHGIAGCARRSHQDQSNPD
jgi:hypothetical protein